MATPPSPFHAARLKALAGRRIVREGGAAAAGQIGAALGLLVGGRILTEVVPPSAFGEAALVLGLAVLARNVFVASIHQACVRFLPLAVREGRTEDLAALLRRRQRRGLLLGSALLGATAAGYCLLRASLDAVPSFAFAVGVLLVDGATGLLASWANGTRQQARYAAWSVVNAWSRPLCAAAFVGLAGPFAWVIVSGHLAGAMLARTLLRAPRVSRSPDDDWVGRIEPQVVRFGRPFAAMAWVGWVTQLGDRYVLAVFHGSVDVGIYVAAYGLASQPFVLLAAFLAVWLRPALFDAAARGDARRALRILQVWGLLAVGVGAMGVAALGAVSSLIVRLLLGPGFRDAAPLLVFIGAAYALQTVQQTFETVLQLRHETWKMLLCQVVNASVCAVGYFVLIPGGGARGAAIATVVGFASSSALALVLALSGGGLTGQAFSSAGRPDEHVSE